MAQIHHSNSEKLIPIAVDKASNIFYEIAKNYWKDEPKMSFIYKLEDRVSARESGNPDEVLFTQQELKVLKILYDNIEII